MKPPIGIDVDGVLAAFNEHFIVLSRKLLGKSRKVTDVTNFDYTQCGWTKAEVKRIFSYIRHTEDFWTTLERLPHTSSLSKHAKDYEYFFITSRMSTDGIPVQFQTEQWLRQQYGLKDPYAIVSQDKGATATELELAAFIDDRDTNVVAVANARPDCKVYLVDQPYNKQLDDKRIKRVESINEFFKELKK